MSNELIQSGVGGVALQDIKDSKIDITQILGDSSQYNDWLDQLNTQEEFFALIPENDTEKRLKISDKINELKEKIKQLKKDVLTLAETFERIEINTERLKRAKALFDKGEIPEARAVLESEFEQMRDEQAQLIDRRTEFEEEILPKLRNNSEEFLMLALLKFTDYDNKDRFKEIQENLELSIKSLETKENLFHYATFLFVAHRAAEAKDVFEQLEKKFGDELSNEVKIAVYVSLAGIYAEQNDFRMAENSSSKAIELLNLEESAAYPSYKFNLAGSYQNLGVSYQFQGKYSDAEKNYDKALAIFYELYEKNVLVRAAEVVTLHCNLGIVLAAQDKVETAHEHYKKAAEILTEVQQKHNFVLIMPAIQTFTNWGLLYKVESKFDAARESFLFGLSIVDEVVEDSPEMYLPSKARFLLLLGDVSAKKDNYLEAHKLYEEALAIITEFVKKAPEFHAILYSIILANLSESYCKNKVNREISIKHAAEAMRTIAPLLTNQSPLGEYWMKAFNTLKEWGLTSEEIDALVPRVRNQE